MFAGVVQAIGFVFVFLSVDADAFEVDAGAARHGFLDFRQGLLDALLGAVTGLGPAHEYDASYRRTGRRGGGSARAVVRALVHLFEKPRLLQFSKKG